VEIRGTVARLLAEGALKVQYDFGSPLNDGLVALGSRNSAARFDDVVVQPLDGQEFEFVELVNTSNDPVALDAWTLANAVEFLFPQGTTLGPGEALAVVGFDPADGRAAGRFREIYQLDAATPLAGPYTGNLRNGGELVRLMRPIRAGDPSAGLILADEVNYDDMPPWPAEADRGGQSLHRQDAKAFGNFAESWTAHQPSPGLAHFTRLGDMDMDGVVDTSDIDALVLALNDPATYEAAFGVPATLHGDADHDGDVDFDDLDDFVAILELSASERRQENR
jgi:hypothetical protein